MGLESLSKLPVTLLVFLCALSTGYGQESQWELGLRSNTISGDGLPTSDTLGFGVISRFYLNDGWFAGAAIDTAEYDFEHTSAFLGGAQDPSAKAIDAAVTNTIFSAFMGRQYGDMSKGFDWFWTAGLGVGFPDVEDVGGPVDGGGSFDITTNSGTEIHLITSLGTSYHFSSEWSATFTARVEQHFLDHRLTNRVTDTTTTIDSQTPIGVSISLNRQF
jgi:hypothetical protein